MWVCVSVRVRGVWGRCLHIWMCERERACAYLGQICIALLPLVLPERVNVSAVGDRHANGRGLSHMWVYCLINWWVWRI